MTTEHFVKLEKFEGPLDLLIHLIRVHELDIFDIDIYMLTTEYLQYLRLIEFQDLAVAGEFLEMAATLAEIKSRLLLPHDKANEDDEDFEDPRADLQERLIQHEIFRGVSEYLAGIPQLGVELQPCNEWKRLEPLMEGIEGPLSGDPSLLVILYEQMLKGLADRKKSKVNAITHKITVEEAIKKLAAEIETSKFALFQGYYNRFESRYDLVVYILAMLELSKMHKLKIYQQDMMGPIWMYRPDCDESDLPINHTAVRDYSDMPDADLQIKDETVEVAHQMLLETSSSSEVEG
jgi:segregation and condensation protein A